MLAQEQLGNAGACNGRGSAGRKSPIPQTISALAHCRRLASGGDEAACDSETELGASWPIAVRKTESVRGLFDLGAVLELNCANLKSICLDGFNPLKHKCLLWDEGTAKLVADNRKVFQHPTCLVDLGHSPAGQHVRHYFLNHCCSVITTNRWHEDVQALPVSDREWLSANVVVFDIDQPLWEAPREMLMLENDV